MLLLVVAGFCCERYFALSEDGYKLQISWSDKGPMVNVRANDPAELEALLTGITADTVAQAIGATGETLRAILALGPVLAPQGTAPGSAPAAPGEQLERYFKADELRCPEHGPRILKKGVSAKNGKPYVSANCGPNNRACATVWGKI